MQLEPGEKFIISRQIDNPADTGPHYVRAVVRDAKTDALLATVNLTDRSDNRFTGEWIVYSKRDDGFYVSITTSVYTDFAYTTKSTVYGEEMDTYLVESRQRHYGGGIGREGVLSAVREALGERKEEKREEKDYAEDFRKLMNKLASLSDTVAGIEVKPKVTVTHETVDLSMIMRAFEAFAKAQEAAIASSGQESARLVDMIQKVAVGLEKLATLVDSKDARDAVKQVETAVEGVRKLVEPPPKRKERVSPYFLIREIRRKHG